MNGNLYTPRNNPHASPSTETIVGSLIQNATIGDIQIGKINVKRTESPYRIMADTTENWNIQTDFLPKAYTLVIYTDHYQYEKNGEIIEVPGIKVGDGNSYLIDLPFISDYSDIAYLNYKSHTTDEWEANKNYIPKRNEVIIYTDKFEAQNDGNRITVAGIKIGDGNAYVSDLPFITDKLETMIEDHINDNERHITENERMFWNNKLNCTVTDETLVLNRL